MTEENTGGLSAAEEAYFSSGGEAEITAEPAPVVDAEQIQPDANSGPDVPDPAQDQSQVRDEKGRFVPHQALHAEREEHKKTKQELEQIRQQQAILNDRWNTLLTATKQQEQPQPEAPPDPNEDIFAYAKWQGDQLKALQERIENRDKSEQQQQQIAEQERELWGHWSQSAQSYAAEAPDFGDAVKFLSDTRTRQLKALAAVDPRFADENGVLGQINAELKSIVVAAKERGENPAKVVHELAKAYGFAATAAQQPQAPNGLTEKLAQIDAAQNASRTLAASPGRNAGDPISPEAIASMSNAEFEAWMKVPENAKRFQSMMGG
ncbi:hypothetical protein KEM44_21100 [Sinorhizobium meliloti]|nr:hypothetical protein KEM44_21100 [Sinorhizobium meliloti]